jgi:radical SAM superfamily enzyme YgiQ (UPF0313 family)
VKKSVLLFDLPTYPKGILSLSLLSVASCLKNDFNVEIVDLNIEEYDTVHFSKSDYGFVGLKVSSQNFKIASELTQKIKAANNSIKVIWGGEFPTLMPEESLENADTIFCGLFEPVAKDFIYDLQNNSLRKVYSADTNYSMDIIPKPDFSMIKNINNYYSFMGLPMETSRGCTEKCSFCMVHVMQKKNYYTKSISQLNSEIETYSGHFINIIDYNLGVDKEHIISIAETIKKSGALGWMAEMCIELLDDDELLKVMSDSRCKMIYCGLESIDDVALQSVHKMNTNHIENYERIIRKVQSYGIQIGAGLILGMSNTNELTFQRSLDFFQRMGLIYVKLTFLTYNPGTKVKKYMEKKGTFIAKNLEDFDGLHMSYLPYDVQSETVISGTEYFIRRFYSFSSIIRRSLNTKLSLSGKIEFIIFSYCYGRVYHQWLRNGFLRKPDNFGKLLKLNFKKSIDILMAEKILCSVRSSMNKPFIPHT